MEKNEKINKNFYIIFHSKTGLDTEGWRAGRGPRKRQSLAGQAEASPTQGTYLEGLSWGSQAE